MLLVQHGNEPRPHVRLPAARRAPRVQAAARVSPSIGIVIRWRQGSAIRAALGLAASIRADFLLDLLLFLALLEDRNQHAIHQLLAYHVEHEHRNSH